MLLQTCQSLSPGSQTRAVPLSQLCNLPCPRPAKPKAPGIPAQFRTLWDPTASFASQTLGRGCQGPTAQLKVSEQQRGRGCISFITRRALPAARVTFLRTARDCSSLERAVFQCNQELQAGQSSPTLQESNHRQFRQFLFSATTQLQAEASKQELFNYHIKVINYTQESTGTPYETLVAHYCQL